MNGRTGRERRPTISEVATAAGVSRSTVSRVFSRPGPISAATIARVRDTAERLGYRPNPTARALSTGRNRNLAVFVPDIANPFFPPLIAEVQDAAERADYFVFLASSGEIAAREAPLAERLGAQVEGMLLVSPRMADAELEALAADHALVLINRDLAGVARVLIDSAIGTREAVHHLADLGHRHLAYVAGPEASWSNAERARAVRAVARERALTVTTVPSAAPTFEAGRAVVSTLLESAASAAVAFDDQIAQGILAGLDERGLGVPDAMSLVGCDDVLGAVTRPALTTVSNRSALAGRLALELLLERLEGDLQDAPRRLIDTALVPRQSTGAPGPTR